MYNSQLDKLKELEEQLDIYKSKEIELKTELKKRGDNARKLILEKDKEIFTLKEKISANLNTNTISNNVGENGSVNVDPANVNLHPPDG